MSKREFQPGTVLAPVPPVMVSCGSNEIDRNIITVAWTGIINSNPPMTYISVRKSRHSHRILRENGEFVINLTTADLAEATDFCGVRSGRDVDKFRQMNLTPVAASHVSCPLIGESPVNLECKVFEIKELPSHDMFLAEIIAFHVNEEWVDEAGKILFEKMNLLAYNHGAYYPLSQKNLGRFGFSVMKPKTKKKKAAEERRKKSHKISKAKERNTAREEPDHKITHKNFKKKKRDNIPK